MPITTSSSMRHVKGSGGRQPECGEWSFFPRNDGGITSHTFSVHQEPVVLVAACMGVGHYAQLQTTPDEGGNWVDVIIYGQSIRMTPENTLLYIPLSGRYRLVYTGSPIGRITGRLHTLTHEAGMGMVSPINPMDYLTVENAQKIYLAKQYDTANDLTIKDTLDTPAFSRLVFSSSVLKGALYPEGHGASGIELRNGPGELMRFQMAYSDITWALHCYGNEGVVRLPDAVQFDRNTQAATFYGNVSVIGPPMTVRRGLGKLDVWDAGPVTTVLNDCTGGGTIRQTVDGNQVFLDFINLTYVVPPPYVPGPAPVYGAGPVAKIRHADGAGTLQDRLVFTPAGVFLPNLPTIDPHVVGQVWNSAGALHVSLG